MRINSVEVQTAIIQLIIEVSTANLEGVDVIIHCPKAFSRAEERSDAAADASSCRSEGSLTRGKVNASKSSRRAMEAALTASVGASLRAAMGPLGPSTVGGPERRGPLGPSAVGGPERRGPLDRALSLGGR